MHHVRAMTGDDIGLGLRLKEQAGWNQTAADWARFLALEPGGCFVAELDGQPVGTATTCTLAAVGWIAMVLVDPAARHQGIGTRLVTHAIAYLQQRELRTIRLDATALGRPVYERLGFAAEYELVRLEGRAEDRSEQWRADVEIVLPPALERESLAAIDQQVTGTDRRRLFAQLWSERPEAVAQAVVSGSVQGYVMFRSGSRATQIGPAVASTAETGCALLDWACSRCAGQPVLVDIPRDNRAAIDWALARGLVPQREFTRMYREYPIWDQPELLWASSGPEKG